MVCFFGYKETKIWNENKSDYTFEDDLVKKN